MQPTRRLRSRLAELGVQTAPPSFSVWVAPSLVRVGKTDAVGTTSSISLSSARGETVDTQVVVQGPSGGLTNVNVSASALTGPGGATIPASNVTLYREYYLTVNRHRELRRRQQSTARFGHLSGAAHPFNALRPGRLCGTAATLKACNATVSAGQNTTLLDRHFRAARSYQQPAGNLHGQHLHHLRPGQCDRSGYADRVELWTSRAALGTFSMDALASRCRQLPPPRWVKPCCATSHGLVRCGWQRVLRYHQFRLNRSGWTATILSAFSATVPTAALLLRPSQINAAAANFPAGLGLDFYLADE